MIIVFALVQAVNPRAVWALNQRMNSWTYQDRELPEPSSAYLVAARLSGLAIVAIAVFLLVRTATRG